MLIAYHINTPVKIISRRLLNVGVIYKFALFSQ